MIAVDTESLKLFRDVIQLRSFTRAAANHGLTQSAISQRIKALEHALGARLIERGNRNLSLTSAGQIVFAMANRILDDLKTLEDRLTELRGNSEGQVSVEAILSVGLYELNPFVRKLFHQRPSINVVVDYASSKKIYLDVINGVVDLGIVAYPRKHSKIQSLIFREDELVLVCHPSHRFSNLGSVKIRDIANEFFVTFYRDAPTRKTLDRILKDHGIAPKIQAEFDNIELIKRAVESNIGVSILPSIAVIPEVESGCLKRVHFADGPFIRPIGAIYRRGRSLPSAVKIFLDVLINNEVS